MSVWIFSMDSMCPEGVKVGQTLGALFKHKVSVFQKESLGAQLFVDFRRHARALMGSSNNKQKTVPMSCISCFLCSFSGPGLELKSRGQRQRRGGIRVP